MISCFHVGVEIRTMNINRHTLDDRVPLLVFEVGINHNGDLLLAMDTISEVMTLVDKYEYPRDSVFFKFQKRDPTVEVPREQWNKPRRSLRTGKMTTYIEYKHEIEFWKKEYDAIHKIISTRYTGVRWLTSVWGLTSLAWMVENYRLQEFVKIPSAMVTNLDLIKRASKPYPNVIVSTGGATRAQIQDAVDAVDISSDMYLLICTSTYPTEHHEVGLNRLHSYCYNWGNTATIGYSSHSASILVPVAAAIAGAGMIEFHVTLDRAMAGSDHAASIEIGGVGRIIRDILVSCVIGGNGKIGPTKSEEEKLGTLRND